MKKSTVESRKSSLAVVCIALGAILAILAGWYFYARHSGRGVIRNVVLISIDTCRADHLSCYGFKRPTTPNIDAVAQGGILFKHALSPVPLTTPAHSSMLTGTYPPTHGVRLNNGERLADSNVTLAEILRDAGYQTAAFVGAFPLDFQFGLSQGFDAYDCKFTRKIEKSSSVAERTAEEVTHPVLTWLEKHAAKPFFLFLHYYDPHAPYKPPPSYAAAFSGDLYAGEIAYVDNCIGQVVDRLRTLGLDENTLLIITADHGEGLGEHGEKTHAFYIYQSTQRVPLIIRVPGGSRGRQVEENVSLVDIMPTVLDLLGLESPADVQGVSMRSCLNDGPLPTRNFPLYCESLEAATFGCSPLQGLIAGPWKYIRTPRPEIYDLIKDPGELTNLIERESKEAYRLRGRLEQMLREMEAAAPQRGRSRVDAETLKKLASLGYVGGGATPEAAAFNPLLEDPKEFLVTYERLQKANSLFLSNRSENAKQELLAIVGSYPRLVTAHALLAQIAVRERRLDEAAVRCAAIVSILAESKNPTKSLLPDAKELATGTLDTRDLSTAHCNLAVILHEMGKNGEAIEHFNEALRIRPGYADARYNLATALLQTGKLPEAVAQYEEALRLQPSLAKTTPIQSALTEARAANEAIVRYEQELQVKPDDLGAHNNLGNVLRQFGRAAEAIGHYEQALRINPDNADVHYNIAAALAQTGKLTEAIGHYTDAIRFSPDFLPALNNLAWIRATHADPKLRNGAEAVGHAKHACELTDRKNFGYLDTLAAAYAEDQRFPEAVATAEEAVALAKSGKQQAPADEIGTRLILYRAGQPYRDSPPVAGGR